MQDNISIGVEPKPSIRRLLPRAGRVTVLLSVMVPVSACREEARPVEAVQPIRAAVVHLAPMSETHSYVGTIKPRYESDLGFRVAGKITARLVNVGDAVLSGQVLARLDPIDYRLSRESSEAELKAARSSLSQAEADEGRFRKLNQQAWVSNSTFEQKKAIADEARGRVERAMRALELARNQLDYTELRATNTGIVTALPVETGQVVAPGQLICRVARLDELEVAVSIPEGRLESDRSMEAHIALWASPESHYEARLREISPDADRATRTFQARYTILHPDARLALGKTATVVLARPRAFELMRLPLAAVFKDQGPPSVWLIDEAQGRVRKTEVEVTRWDDGSVVVSHGLEPGQKIVALGVHKLDAGKRVRIVETTP